MSRYRIGDGDFCPLEPEHGQMFVLQGAGHRAQFCPQQSHDGVWAEGAKSPPTPNIWPFNHLAEAVARYHGSKPVAASGHADLLPDLDIGELI